MVQGLGFGAFTAVGPGLIPGLGTKIPQAVQHSQKKKLMTSGILKINIKSFKNQKCFKAIKTDDAGKFPGSPVGGWDSVLLLLRARVRSLAEELRSHKPRCVAKGEKQKED